MSTSICAYTLQMSLDFSLIHQDVLRTSTDVVALFCDILLFYKCQVNITQCGYSYGTFYSFHFCYRRSVTNLSIIIKISLTLGIHISYLVILIEIITKFFRPEAISLILNTELNPTCCLLALLGANLVLNVSRVRINLILPDMATK
jgi:hypothetical protein